jgi:hypothetical protein
MAPTDTSAAPTGAGDEIEIAITIAIKQANTRYVVIGVSFM